MVNYSYLILNKWLKFLRKLHRLFQPLGYIVRTVKTFGQVENGDVHSSQFPIQFIVACGCLKLQNHKVREAVITTFTYLCVVLIYQ